MSRAVRLPRALAFLPLAVVDEAGRRVYNPELRRRMQGASGVYVFRRKGKKRAAYVGESHTGRAWKTALRHVQAVSTFRERGEWAPCNCPTKFSLAFIPCAADDALALEARAIRRYAPRANLRQEQKALEAEVGF